jgi:hypothetical protein
VEEEDEDDGIEEENLQQIMDAHEDLAAPPSSSTGLFIMPGRDPIGPPEWGDDLTARYLQEQRNACAEGRAVNGPPEDILIAEPPTGPPGHIIIPAKLEHALAIYDALVASTRPINRHLYPEPAFQSEIQQYVLTMQSPWLDRNLYRIDIVLKRQIIRPADFGTHFLIALMRPDEKARWARKAPRRVEPTADGPVDTSDDGATLDIPTPPRLNLTPEPGSEAALSNNELPQPDVDNVLPCELTTDVDSLIVLADRLPLLAGLKVPSMPSPKDTVMYSNKLCLPAGPSKCRTLLSKIPNFRLGTSSESLTVNMFFPDAFDPDTQGMGSCHISEPVMEALWDEIIQPAVSKAFSAGAANSMPQSKQYERDRQAEVGGRIRPSCRSTRIPSDQISTLVNEMTARLTSCDNPLLASYKSFKFLISLAGYKSYSLIRYDDLTQAEYQWCQELGLGGTELNSMMLLKGYLKGLRRVTKDYLSSNWMDFNEALQQGVARIRRQRDWEQWPNEEQEYPEEELLGDDQDRLAHPHRRREGPSFQLKPSMGNLCKEDGCTTCGVWIDVAMELGCSGKVTVWNHSHCFDIM